jgi:hypothetical protein
VPVSDDRYRFLLTAEEEMTGASVFYEAATAGLGAGFLDEVERVITSCASIRSWASPLVADSDEQSFTAFHLA